MQHTQARPNKNLDAFDLRHNLSSRNTNDARRRSCGLVHYLHWHPEQQCRENRVSHRPTSAFRAHYQDARLSHRVIGFGSSDAILAKPSAEHVLTQLEREGKIPSKEKFRLLPCNVTSPH